MIRAWQADELVSESNTRLRDMNRIDVRIQSAAVEGMEYVRISDIEIDSVVCNILIEYGYSVNFFEGGFEIRWGDNEQDT